MRSCFLVLERTAKRKKGLLDLDPPPRFDLVIVDEAHHIRNQDTFSHKAVRFFCDHAEAVIFLTATPIQLGSNDLFVLLNTLRPDLIIDQESFANMAEPNPYINQAISFARAQVAEWQIRTREALDQAAATAWGQAILRHNPNFIRICSRLSEGDVTNEERVQFITDMEAMHTFAGIINRTRRRDIGDFTIRKPETVVVP
ncbi:MAG: SNF2-related protein, partial [Kiritimatiellia bacterium]